MAKVDVTFVAGQPPVGEYDGPSEALAAAKAEFGTSRIRRWFGSRLALTDRGGTTGAPPARVPTCVGGRPAGDVDR